jgi:hypothetical protein
MTQAEDEALANAQNVCSIANLVLDAMNNDPLRTAKGLVVIASVLATGHGHSFRSSLSRYLLQTARELEPRLAITCLPRSTRLH